MANLYVCSQNTNDVRTYLATGQSSIFASGNGLNQPWGIAVDSTGRFYIASRGSSNVLRFNSNGSFDKVFASGNGLSKPTGLVFDSNGKLYVGDNDPANNNVLRFNADGTFDKIFATGNGLNLPNGMVFDTSGKFYVASYGSGQVLRFNSDGSFDKVFCSAGPSPTGIAFDANGKLYVAVNLPTGVLRFNSGGTYDQLFAASGPMSSIQGIVFGTDRNLYVACGFVDKVTRNSSVLQFTGTSGAFNSIWAAGGGLDWPFGIVFA
jgi:serine/threonine-protein kinase